MLVSGSILGQLELELLFIGAQTKDDKGRGGINWKRKSTHVIFHWLCIGGRTYSKTIRVADSSETSKSLQNLSSMPLLRLDLIQVAGVYSSIYPYTDEHPPGHKLYIMSLCNGYT